MTTNYDPGITDARIRVRPGAASTGFTTWEDELGLDRWRTGDVFGEDELPVLFAHGQHNRPDSIVLATTEYRRAYAGKLPHVLARLIDGHLVWLGFSFADQRIAAILREIADHTGTRIDPGAAPRHVAVMAWDPAAEASAPGILARRAEIAYGAQLVLYPAPGGDHSALGRLLADLTDDRFPPAADLPARADLPPSPTSPSIPVRWVPGPERVEHFTGRAEELARLDRWAAEPQVSLVGVTAWGGAGKTALVTHWVQDATGASRRPGLRGVFGWSFYADPSAEHWAQSLLEWARQEFGIAVDCRPASGSDPWPGAHDATAAGAGRAGEGAGGPSRRRVRPAAGRHAARGAGRRLPAAARWVGAADQPVPVRRPGDLRRRRGADAGGATVHAGRGVRTAGRGRRRLAPGRERQDLVRAVDGHALATGVLAGLLAALPLASDLATLRAELTAAARTDARVGKVLEFYADRLSEPDRYLLAAVSLFARPVPAEAVLAVAAHEAFGFRLARWTSTMVQAAVRDRLGGLASWHPDGTISAHPLVRDTFRPLVMAAVGTAAETSLAGLPAGKATSRPDALRVVEAIELLLDADQWQPADGMYRNRSDNGVVWLSLPAARLGQRAATAFVATPTRRAACAAHLNPGRVGYYLNSAGLHAMNAGDLATAREYLPLAVRHARDAGDVRALMPRLRNLAFCLIQLGLTGPLQDASEELATTETDSDQKGVRDSLLLVGLAAALVGDSAKAEQQFIAADQIELADDPEGDHLYAIRGTWWAEWLVSTGRSSPARTLTVRNADINRKYGWNENVARCDRLLGRMALTAGDNDAARKHLTSAAACFREGDYLIELAITLTDLADHARATGDLDAAKRHVTEAITIAAPRGLVPAHSAALAARARIRAAQAAATADQNLLFQGRDAADAALRLAVRHQLAWHELDALRAHVALDQAERLTAAGPPRPTPCTPGWSRPAWTPTRWPPSSGSSRPRKARKVSADGGLVDQRADRHRGRGRPDPADRGRARVLRRPGQPPDRAGPVGQPDRGHPPPGHLRPAGSGPEPATVLRHVRWRLEGNRAPPGHRHQAPAGPDHVRQPGAVLRTAVRRLPPVHDRPVRHVRHHWRRRPAARPDRLQMGRPPQTALVGRIHDRPVCHPRQRNR